MTIVLIILHVLAAVLFIGPTTVAVSTFQGQALKAHAGDTRAAGTAALLHRITRSYGVLSILVPLLGVATMATNWSVYATRANFHTAIAVAVIAWALLLVLIIPQQRKMMGALGLLEADEHDPEEDVVSDWDRARSRLSMFGGVFALLWVVMLALMYINF
ncbi:hypothetical protein [Corynebacterium halotolerans]|uniref:DUF2269 domain-containing protein n=1 Tax=Corynebacterium halotolerans YIM 70093 = DSM 44683 TaxID=1121362 RepID=M1NLA0_9CORY|nr:hypothetical protein [Corynebacterium halotolerans]AGF72183.1 hypothetical protein A605_05885 [Corynebacterium halotolerans YIM 70093 = DSM 44683]